MAIGDPETQRISTNFSLAQAGLRGGNLVYPADVGTMSKSNHYVQFFINQQQQGRFAPQGGPFNPGPTQQPRNLSVDRAPTIRTLGSITLYMPAQIQVSQKANYGEAEIGLAVAAALGTGKMFTEGFDFGKFAGTVGQEGAQAIANTLEGAGATGAKAALAIQTGKTTNNRTEMKFEGIDRRAFQFSFRLLPRSQKEANNIKDIVTLFRFHSMPEIEGDTGRGRTLISPSTFDIQYHPDQHLHKISTCVLEAVDVKYGGDRPQFFKDGHPSETELTLSFKELEIITKERVAAGF